LVDRGGFKEWPVVQCCAVADEALATWSSEATPSPETPTGFRSRPVEVGTNIEVEALLVSGDEAF